MEKQKLGDIATVEISGVDKKTKDGEQEIRLCNFVDIYYNWAITTAQHDGFMFATARPNEISKFQLKSKHSVNHVFLSPTSIINFTSKKQSYDDTRRSSRDNELLQRAQSDL